MWRISGNNDVVAPIWFSESLHILLQWFSGNAFPQQMGGSGLNPGLGLGYTKLPYRCGDLNREQFLHILPLSAKPISALSSGDGHITLR